MYNNNEIQKMIDHTNQSPATKHKVLSAISNDNDRNAIIRVLDDGYVETFDRYDSDVCEQFINAYLKSAR